MHKRDEATMGWTDKKRAEEMEWKEHEAKSRCGSFLTCPTHWIAWRGGEDLWGKVLEGHDLSMVLNNGLQVERPLLIAGSLSLRNKT